MKKAAAVVVGVALAAAIAAQAKHEDPAGGTVPAASAASAAPAAARDRLAISQQGIVLIDPSGRDKRVLTKHRGWLDESPTWSPDGSRIAFTRTKDGYRTSQIYVKRVAGGRARRLTDGRFNQSPAWSPDGRLIVYNGDGLRVIRPDGSGDRRVRRFGAGANDVAWSPDGSRIAWANHPWVWIARWNGTGKRRVVRGRAPDWSPDGRKLAYMPPKGGVATIGVNGKGRRYLSNGLLPAWSPDGKKIAFNTWPPNNVFDLWVISPDGKHKRRIAREGSYPAWRPLPR